MKPQRVARPWRGRLSGEVCLGLAAVIAGGCKSDLNQQLLERELRYQEDQIYQLQDTLAEQCARLEHVAGENASLRRQLGVSEHDNAAPARGSRQRSPTVAPAVTVPPAIEIPDASPLPSPRGGTAPRGGGPPAGLAPPTLEGVPPLPAQPGGNRPTTDASEGLSLPPATVSFDPAARPIESAAFEPAGGATPAEASAPALVRMSYEDAATVGTPVRLVVNRSGSSGIDTDGDGRSEGLALAIEPRDADERLTAASGDVTITAYDAATAEQVPLARWTVPAAEAEARFRPTGRRRGLVVELPWQGRLPTGGHVRVTVVAESHAGPLEAEALVAVR